MIQITLDKEKQDVCETTFLEIMESRLPFFRSEIYGEDMEAKDDKSDKQKSEIEDARIVLRNYPELYRFLYLASERDVLPTNKEEVAKRPVYKDRLKQLLIGRHDEMTEGNRRKCLADMIGEIGKIEEGAPELLGKIFRYDKFAYSVDAKRLLKKLGITVCPYCNRMFIATIERSDTKKRWNGTRPQFDHYFNKDRYPYLAVNFYNLIPSCSSCNQYKHELDTYEEPLLYPYDEGMGQEYVFAAYPVRHNWEIFYENIIDKKEDIKLFIEPKPINIYKNKDVSASERIELEKRIQTSINKLHLEDLYNMHTDYVTKIIRSGYLYNDAYIRMLSERFPKMKFSMQDVKEIMYCKDLSEEHWGQNILAKLAYDMDTETNI